MELTAEQFRKAVKDGLITIDGSRPKFSSKAMSSKLFPDKDFVKKAETHQEQLQLQRNEIKEQKERNEDLLVILRRMLIEKKALYIPRNVPSSKNSKEIKQMFTKNSVCHSAPLYKTAQGVWICERCNNPAQRLTRPTLDWSDLCKDYRKETEPYYTKYASVFKELAKDYRKPYPFAIYFIRERNNTFDYINAAQIILDLAKDKKDKEGNMIEGWFSDDNSLHVNPDFLGFHVDPPKAGVIITLMTPELYQYKSNLLNQ